MPGILADLKVVDLSWIVAGPTVGRALADFGATVIRVESSARVDTARVVGPNHGDIPGSKTRGSTATSTRASWASRWTCACPRRAGCCAIWCAGPT